MPHSTPLELFLVSLRSVTGKKAIPTGSGFTAHCPAHEDRNPSLSVSEGSDGRCLVHCHAGCATESIVAAVELKMADLMPPKSRGTNHQTQSKVYLSSVNHSPDRSPIRPTDKDAQKAAFAMRKKVHREAKPVAGWDYRSADGAPLFWIVRFSIPGGKQYRPLHFDGQKWRFKDPAGPLPLYKLPELLAADPKAPVCFGEGEKTADALDSLGFLSTTTAHGSGAPLKTDLQPATGRTVCLFADNDPAGIKYVETLAARLKKLNPNTVVKIIFMPSI